VNASTSSAVDVAELLVAMTVVIGSLAAGAKWMVKHYLWELRPNHGTSLNDKINGIEDRVGRIEGQVDLIYKHLIGE
jgi:hypothetical protein